MNFTQEYMRMEGTPRLKKRGSLTLGRHHKRDSMLRLYGTIVVEK